MSWNSSECVIISLASVVRVPIQRRYTPSPLLTCTDLSMSCKLTGVLGGRTGLVGGHFEVLGSKRRCRGLKPLY